MALKQQSLFDFFDEPSVNKPTDNVALPKIKKVEEVIVVNEEPIEFEPLQETVIVEEIITVPKKNNRGRVKLADMDAGIALVEVPEDEILFAKKYYSIGIVANMFKVNVSLIRFWEKEFEMLKPKLNGKGDRHFRPEDVKILKQIHHLLREKKYTIEGAKTFLKKNKKSEESFLVVEELEKLKSFLIDLKLSL
jgi:DNA-binding transcriptional MerR regulator